VTKSAQYLVVALLTLFCAWPQTAHSCSCYLRGTRATQVTSQFESSTAVFSALVENVRVVNTTGVKNAFASMRIMTVWKGP